MGHVFDRELLKSGANKKKRCTYIVACVITNTIHATRVASDGWCCKRLSVLLIKVSPLISQRGDRVKVLCPDIFDPQRLFGKVFHNRKNGRPKGLPRSARLKVLQCFFCRTVLHFSLVKSIPGLHKGYIPPPPVFTVPLASRPASVLPLFRPKLSGNGTYFHP